MQARLRLRINRGSPCSCGYLLLNRSGKPAILAPLNPCSCWSQNMSYSGFSRNTDFHDRDSLFFDHRQNVACRILEPGDLLIWTSKDASIVGLDVGQVVVFELDAHVGEFQHCLFDIIYGKIEDGERSGSMVRLRI